MVTAFLAALAYGEDKTRRPSQAGAERTFVPQEPSCLCLSGFERHRPDTRWY